MNYQDFEKRQKAQKEKAICFALAGLTAFMGIMKGIGWFTVGHFPWHWDLVASAVLLARAVFLAWKVRARA